MKKTIKEILLQEVKNKTDDRCTRIAKRKYDVWPSAYASGAVVRCRQGKIWKNESKEEELYLGDFIFEDGDIIIDEKWSKEYKKNINCSNPKGFSQKAHCDARKKRQKGEETKSKSPFNEEVLNEKVKRDFSKEKEQGLHGWFSRRGGKGKSKGWVDCNTCRDGKCKSCGREEGEERSKYPRCRPTPAQCKGYKKPDQKLKESEDDFSWVEDFNYEPVRDAKHLYDLIFDTIGKVKRYGDWKIGIDSMSGVVEWFGNGTWVGLATPEWENEFEIPIEVSDGDEYIAVDIIKTPKFEYVIQVIDWYQNHYFKKVNEILLNWMRNKSSENTDAVQMGLPLTFESSYYGLKDKKSLINEEEDGFGSQEVILQGHKDYRGKVFVHRNLNKPPYWSIKARRGENAGLVIGYDKTVCLSNVTFVVGEKSRQKVLQSNQKNVHAGVVGDIKENCSPDTRGWVPITYNPYNNRTFVRVDNGEPVFKAKEVILKNEKEIWVKL